MAARNGLRDRRTSGRARPARQLRRCAAGTVERRGGLGLMTALPAGRSCGPARDR
jgi:hypothetical protein